MRFLKIIRVIKSVYGRFQRVVVRKQYRVYITTGRDIMDFPSLRDFSFELLNRRDLEQTPMCHEKGRLGKYLTRLDDGHLCYGHKDLKTDAVCSYFWVSEGGKVDQAPFVFDFTLKIPKGRIYVADCQVNEQHRGKQLYTSGLRSIMKRYEGQENLITAETFNIISQKGILSAGYGFIGTIEFMKLFSFSISRYRNMPKNIIALKKLQI